MTHGGKREGSGKKKGSKASHTIQAELYRKRLIEKVIEKQDPIIDALINKALTGDVQAIKEVQERVLGRVSDKLILEDGGFIEALQEAKRLRGK